MAVPFVDSEGYLIDKGDLWSRKDDLRYFIRYLTGLNKDDVAGLGLAETYVTSMDYLQRPNYNFLRSLVNKTV